LIYSFIDGDTNDGVMLEIGIGSHNPQIPSNMIGIGSSGGSIKAFLELFPQWRIWAADIDPSCFFSAPRLNCEVVNQRKLRSLRKLAQKLPKLNLVVVDGLHKFYADFNSLFVLRSKMLCGGVFVIEDIFDAELDRWKPIIAILSKDFAIAIRKRPGGNALILMKSCAQSRDARQDEIEKLRSA
jgi:hypothetical protein